MRREKRKERALLFAAAADVVVQEPRGARIARAEKIAFARGMQAAKAAARERRGAKRITKKASKARVCAAQRSARRRKASGI